MAMQIKEAHVYLDQNVPVFDGNRFMTLRLGIGFTADIELNHYEAGARELHAKAEETLTKLVEGARLNAQERLEQMAEQAADRARQENDLT
jgi:hypothetical protein